MLLPHRCRQRRAPLEELHHQLEQPGRELREEVGLTDPKPGRRLWRAEFVTPEFAMGGGWLRQRDDVYLVRVRAADVSVPNLVDEKVMGHRWWTLVELERSTDLFGPLDLPARVRAALSRASGS